MKIQKTRSLTQANVIIIIIIIVVVVVAVVTALIFVAAGTTILGIATETSSLALTTRLMHTRQVAG